jgi:hypothetical protein
MPRFDRSLQYAIPLATERVVNLSEIIPRDAIGEEGLEIKTLDFVHRHRPTLATGRRSRGY